MGVIEGTCDTLEVQVSIMQRKLNRIIDYLKNPDSSSILSEILDNTRTIKRRMISMASRLTLIWNQTRKIAGIRRRLIVMQLCNTAHAAGNIIFQSVITSKVGRVLGIVRDNKSILEAQNKELTIIRNTVEQVLTNTQEILSKITDQHTDIQTVLAAINGIATQISKQTEHIDNVVDEQTQTLITNVKQLGINLATLLDSLATHLDTRFDTLEDLIKAISPPDSKFCEEFIKMCNALVKRESVNLYMTKMSVQPDFPNEPRVEVRGDVSTSHGFYETTAFTLNMEPSPVLPYVTLPSASTISWPSSGDSDREPVPKPIRNIN